MILFDVFNWVQRPSADLRRHVKTCHRRTYGDGRQKSFWNVGDDDTDEEDDCIQPEVAQNESNDEECDSEEHGNGGDQMNEVTDLAGDRRLAGLKTRGKVGNTSHDCPITRVDDNTPAGAWRLFKKETNQLINFAFRNSEQHRIADKR